MRTSPSRPADPWTEALARARSLPPAEREEVLDHVVTEARPIATRIASRYTGRGEPFEDLFQVASLGLVLAARRFDPDRGVPFAAFAVPTVEGEVKRHFRDHVWAVRPPRSLQELLPRVSEALDRLEQELHQRPSLADLADELGVDVEEVEEALCLGTAYRHLSLDDEDLHAGPLAETLAMPDVRLVEVEDRLAVLPVLAGLPERTRRVLRLHYLEECSQQKVADEVGLSQVHVGRIVRAALTQVRRTMGLQEVPEHGPG